MRAKFDEQLHMLNQEMMHMGSMIEDKIQKAIEALIGQNSALAKEIMEADNEVDREQKKIENICFNLLMQQQPVARDLRVISAAMKMVTDMERIGDHAADISEMTVMMASEPYVVDLSDIKKMASETVLMLIRSIEAYVEKDMLKAQSVIDHDDIVDELFNKVKQELIEMIRKNPAVSEQAADMLMVAKYFERIGDHATNLEELEKEEKTREKSALLILHKLYITIHLHFTFVRYDTLEPKKEGGACSFGMDRQPAQSIKEREYEHIQCSDNDWRSRDVPVWNGCDGRWSCKIIGR